MLLVLTTAIATDQPLSSALLYIQDVFEAFDRNGDGKLSPTEMAEGMGRLDMGFTPRHIAELTDSIDADHDHMVDLNEFVG